MLTKASEEAASWYISDLGESDGLKSSLTLCPIVRDANTVIDTLLYLSSIVNVLSLALL